MSAISPSTSSIGSFVVIKADSITGEHYEHREGIYTEKEGVSYLAPGDYLCTHNAVIDVSGQPSQEESEEEYFKALDSYQGYEEKIDWVLDDMLFDLASNVPGNTQVVGGDQKEYMFAQVEQDIHRLSSLKVDGSDLKDGVSSAGLVSNLPGSIYLNLLKGLGNDIALTQAVTKLITQTNLYRTYFLLWKKFVLENSRFSLATLKKDYTILTKSCIGYLKPMIILKEHVHFAIRDNTLEACEGVRFIKVIRIVQLKKKNLTKGLTKGSKVTNYYSPFFTTKKEMEKFDFSP